MIETSTPASKVHRATTKLFYYRNVTSQLQNVCIDQITFQRLEKLIFPGEQMLFYATPEASLEVYACIATGSIFVHRVPCSELQVLEEMNP